MDRIRLLQTDHPQRKAIETRITDRGRVTVGIRQFGHLWYPDVTLRGVSADQDAIGSEDRQQAARDALRLADTLGTLVK